jgi:AcrR family transcriptional regulator
MTAGDAKNANGEPIALSRSAQRRRREREQRYQTILKAAETLFAGSGYHQTSMEQIADAAEVSTGAVYFYFKNKEDLLLTLLDEIGFLLRRILADEFHRALSPPEGFERAGMAFFDRFCRPYPGKVAIVYRESVGQSPAVEQRRRELFDKLNEDLRSALKRLAAHGGGRGHSERAAEVAAVCIMGIYERVAYHFTLWQDRCQDITAIGTDAVAFILAGVARLMGKEPCT